MSGWYLKSVSSEKTWTNAKTEWGLTNCGQYIYDLSGAPIADGAPLTASNWRKIDTTTDPSLNPLVAYWVKGELASGDSGSGDSGSGDSGSGDSGSGDSGSGDSGSGSGVSEQQNLIVNNGNYTGLTETTIATGVPTNTEIEIVSYTLTNTDSAAVSNIAFTKYHDQNNVFVLYGVLPSGRSVVLKITFSISSEGVLTIQHNGSVLAKGYDQLTSETASNSYDDPLVVYGPTNGGADYHHFTDLIIRY
jgi:hypothetical protein